MRVYVPLDGTPEAERALDPAALLLQRAAAPRSLVLGRIFRDPLAIPDAFANISAVHPRFVREECATKLHYLQEIAQRAMWQGTTVEAKVGLGEPAHMVCEQARLVQADLLVMITHSRTGFEYAMLGSFAEEIVHELSIPTLLIRSEGDVFPDPAHIPTLRILIPFDGSPLAKTILKSASWLASLLQARLFLAQVLPESARAGDPERVNAVDERMMAQRSQLEEAGINAEYRIAWGEPAASLVRVCEEERIDLVAMATHARTILGQKTIGNVARHLLQHTTVPLMLIHPAGA